MADKPVTREEKYLTYLTGDYAGEIPKPITRKEKYLYELCLKGIDGEISPEEIKNAVNEYLEKNPVKPGATTEQAQQIERNKTDIGLLKTETNSLNEDLSQLSEDVNDLKTNGTGGSVKTILANIMTIIRAGDIQYTTDISALANHTDLLIANLGTTDEPEIEQPESGIVQTGSVLAITSGVTATQTGSVLAIV